MSARRPRLDEAGFSLIELLAVIAILGVVSFALTESLILGFKTTDRTIGDVSRSAGVNTLEPYFTRDVQSAELVSTGDPTCAPDPVFLHLTWTDEGAARASSYSLVPPTGGEQDLVRWSCTGAGAPDRRVLGHFSHDPAGPPPLAVTCDEDPDPDADLCPVAPDKPATVTLAIQTDPSAVPGAATKLTVRRRTS